MEKQELVRNDLVPLGTGGELTGQYAEAFEHYKSEIVRMFQIPERMLFQNNSQPLHYNERDAHRYAIHINASLKGVKRRARQRRTFISKMIHKSKVS